jgi:hypothetical protein
MYVENLELIIGQLTHYYLWIIITLWITGFVTRMLRV